MSGENQTVEQPLLVVVDILLLAVPDAGVVADAAAFPTKEGMEQQPAQDSGKEQEQDVVGGGPTKGEDGHWASSLNHPRLPSRHNSPSLDYPASYPLGLGMDSLTSVRAYHFSLGRPHLVLPGLGSQKENPW